MKLRALSHYNQDLDTRFGDCIILFDSTTIVVYDCGHTKHAESVEAFLSSNPFITSVYVVVSHNDDDHTKGVCDLLDWLHDRRIYTVNVYTHQYLKHVDTILDKIDDKRRNRERLKEALLAEFDNIRMIIEKAQECGFPAIEALIGTEVGNCLIVGPTADEFTDTAAKAVDNRESNKIGEGDAEETVMNAASVQLTCILDNRQSILLCGDASPDYLHNLKDYDIIQLPHHGQLADAKSIFENLKGYSQLKGYLISDNTGSACNSGGSYDLVQFMKQEHYTAAHNTKNGVVSLPEAGITKLQGRTCLGDLGSI